MQSPAGQESDQATAGRDLDDTSGRPIKTIVSHRSSESEPEADSEANLNLKAKAKAKANGNANADANCAYRDSNNNNDNRAHKDNSQRLGTSEPMGAGAAHCQPMATLESSTLTSSSKANASRPLILITDPNSICAQHSEQENSRSESSRATESSRNIKFSDVHQSREEKQQSAMKSTDDLCDSFEEEEIDGIRYRIVAAVTKPPAGRRNVKSANDADQQNSRQATDRNLSNSAKDKLNSVRRKSTAFVSSLLQSLGPSQSNSSHELANYHMKPPRRMSIYEMTKSPPPETSLEIYLNERRRSSTVSSKQVQQQIVEQQSTFETNYCARQQYFRDLNQKLLNQDKKLVNVVSNRGQIHRHSVDMAQLPMNLAQANASAARAMTSSSLRAKRAQREEQRKATRSRASGQVIDQIAGGTYHEVSTNDHLDQEDDDYNEDDEAFKSEGELEASQAAEALVSDSQLPVSIVKSKFAPLTEQRGSIASSVRSKRLTKKNKLDSSLVNTTPAPDVKIGQRVAYKEYYGNEFGTIRWIGRVPQISADWTVGVEFDNAIGEGDGSLNGRRYFIAKDCFAKFLPLESVSLVDQHVGRPEPGTMISVMSAAVRPGQMISIQRVSTVHVQHCFLNAPHQKPGADILAVNTRLHCQCPNCGPCAHVIKPPRTERLVGSGKNATHMCQFSTYTCCGMESQEEALCTYTGNKISSLPPPSLSHINLPPVGNSWIEGSGYLTNLQAQQSKLMPPDYRFGAAPEDIGRSSARLKSKPSSRRGSGKRTHTRSHKTTPETTQKSKNSDTRASSTSPNQENDLAIPPEYSPSAYNETPKHQEMNVLHRDSIENRYLFPTDDPVYSDLEDLSQARYGHNSRSRHNSNNFFKSLKSLISCMGSQSERSDFDRFSGELIRQPPNPGYENKSIPAIGYGDKQALMDQTQKPSDIKRHVSTSSDCGFSSASQNSYSSPTSCLDEEKRVNQIYRRVIAELLDSPNLSTIEINRLRSALVEHSSDLSGDKYGENNSSLFVGTTPDIDLNLLDGGEPKNHHWINEVPSPRYILNRVQDDVLSGGDDSAIYFDRAGAKNNKLHNNQSKRVKNLHDEYNLPVNERCIDELSTTGSMIMSSQSESSYSGVLLGARDKEASATIKSQDASNLPKAFELKLTLSINSDKNKSHLKEDPSKDLSESRRQSLSPLLKGDNTHSNIEPKSGVLSTSINDVKIQTAELQHV